MSGFERRTRRAPSRLWLTILPALSCLLATGCSTPRTPEALTIDAGHYELAFDAAIAAARERRMPPAFRDRRAGIIETEPAVAPSLLEPWRDDGASLERRLEQTLGYERRRTRFEFVPTGFAPPAGAEETLTGPDMLALDAQRPDLSRSDAPLELRVRVFVERAHTLGVRRGTWSRRTTTRSDIVERIGAVEIELPSRFWTPVGRDRAIERRLLAAVQQRLASAAPAADRAPD